MGEVEIVCTVSVLELNQEPSKIHWDESVLIRSDFQKFLVCVDTELLILMLSACCLCDLM